MLSTLLLSALLVPVMGVAPTATAEGVVSTSVEVPGTVEGAIEGTSAAISTGTEGTLEGTPSATTTSPAGTVGVPAVPTATSGVATGETYAHFCDAHLCIDGVRSNGTESYTLTPVTPIPEEQFGWIALGFGTAMINSPMVLMWPNDDCSYTLSQRQTDKYAPPNVVQPARAAAIDEEKSYANATATAFTFSLPAGGNATVPLIFAYSGVNPNSSSPAAAIRKHDWKGHATLQFAGKKRQCKPKSKRSRRA